MCRESVISIHALRVEGDFLMLASSMFGRYFYPRPPGGGRLALYLVLQHIKEGISIHALRVEGD